MKGTAFGGLTMTCASLALGACGGHVAIGGAEPGDGGSEAGEQEAAGQEGAAGDAPAGQGGPDAATIAQTSTVATDVIAIAPANEATFCQVFANPFGKDVDIVAIDGTTDVAHDIFLFSLPASTGQTQPTSLTDCTYDPVGVQPFLFYSHQTQLTTTYPAPSMGYPLPAQNLLMVRAHYLNLASETAQAHTTVALSAAKPGVVTIPVGSIFLRYSHFPVAATSDGGPAIASHSAMPIDSRYTIFASWSFASPAGAEVRVTAGGSPFYDVTNAESFSPLLIHDPVIEMGLSQTLAWSCTYGVPATAQADGQCVYQGFYYDADPTTPDVIVDVVPP